MDDEHERELHTKVASPDKGKVILFPTNPITDTSAAEELYNASRGCTPSSWRAYVADFLRRHYNQTLGDVISHIRTSDAEPDGVELQALSRHHPDQLNAAAGLRMRQKLSEELLMLARDRDD